MIFMSYAVMVLGLLFILIGVVGAAFKVAGERPRGFAATAPGLGDVVKDLPKLIAAIAGAPTWLGTTIVGVGLVVVGFQMQAGGWPFAHPAA